MAKAEEIKPIAKPKPGPGKPGVFAGVLGTADERKGARARTKMRIHRRASGHVKVTVVQMVAKTPIADREGLLIKVKSGLPYRAVETLAKSYESSIKEIGEVLLIPSSTMSRRKRSGKLNPDESDRVVRFARIMDAATELMGGDTEAAAQWMRTPRKILGGETPLAHASTEIGARDVEDLINRLEHGVFS